MFAENGEEQVGLGVLKKLGKVCLIAGFGMGALATFAASHSQAESPASCHLSDINDLLTLDLRELTQVRVTQSCEAQHFDEPFSIIRVYPVANDVQAKNQTLEDLLIGLPVLALTQQTIRLLRIDYSASGNASDMAVSVESLAEKMPFMLLLNGVPFSQAWTASAFDLFSLRAHAIDHIEIMREKSISSQSQEARTILNVVTKGAGSMSAEILPAP